MLQELLDPVLELITSLTRYELGSNQYDIVFAVSTLVWLIVARVLMGLLKSDRGIFAALFALAIPLFFGLLAYSLAKVKVAPLLEAQWAEQYLPLGILVFVVLILVIFTSKFFISLNGVSGLIVFAFATTAAVIALVGTEVALETFEKSREQIKHRKEEKNDDIDAVL